MTVGQLRLNVIPSVPAGSPWALRKLVNEVNSPAGDIAGTTWVIDILPLALALSARESASLHCSARGQERSHYTELREGGEKNQTFPPNWVPPQETESSSCGVRDARPDTPLARRLPRRPCARPVLSGAPPTAVPAPLPAPPALKMKVWLLLGLLLVHEALEDGE